MAKAKGQDRVLRIGPQEGPQTALVDCPFEDVFLGGGRGGGKTYGLILDFAYFERRWGNQARGIIFRRSYPELEEVILKGREVLVPMGARYNATTATFTWPSGAFLRMRHLDKDADADKYQGHQYTWQGFDELQNWPNPKPIDRLMATLRSVDPDVPKLRRSTGNPGGAGHQWVYDRYIRRGAWKVEEIRTGLRRVWIPAHLDDNRLLMENDPGYEARLAESGGPKLYAAWRWGQWDAIEGAYFDFDGRVGGRHVKRDREIVIPYWSRRWVSMDWGFDHYAAILWHAYLQESRRFVTYREVVTREKPAEDLADIVVQHTRRNEEVLDSIVLSFDCFARKVDEQTIAKRMDEVFRQNDLPSPVAGVRKRVVGWRHMDDLLRHDRWVIAESCERLRETLPVMMHDPDDREDCLKFPGDDAAESARIGLMTAPAEARKKNLDDYVSDRVKLTKVVEGREVPTDPIQREIEMKRALVEYLGADD